MAKKNYYKRKNARQKAVFWVLAIALVVGLIGSSIAWSLGPISNINIPHQTGPQDIAKAQAQMLQSQIKNLEQAVQKNPKLANLRLALGDAYTNAGRFNDAIKSYQVALNLDPKNEEANLKLATAYYYAKEYDAALNQVNKVLAADPNNLVARFNLGIILAYGKKDIKGGLAELQKVVAQGKSGPVVDNAKTMIKQLQQGSNKGGTQGQPAGNSTSVKKPAK